MLSSAATVEIVERKLKEYGVKSIVLDPVGLDFAKDGMPSVLASSQDRSR